MTRTRPHRQIPIALSLLTATLALLALAPASQAKVVVDAFGFPGPEGGHLNIPTGIAINQTGAGGVPPGTLYAAEYNEGNAEGKYANRIQRLDPEGHFERLWGLDVAGPNEIQKVTITFGSKGDALTGTVGGFFTLSLGGDTAKFAIEDPYPSMIPTRQELQSGLEALPAIGPGNVRVSASSSFSGFNGGGTFEIEFVGARSGTDLQQLILDDSEIAGPAPISTSVSTVQDGFGGNFAGFEICTVAAECKRGTTAEPAPGGQVKRPGAIAVDQASGNVYVSDNADSRIEEFDADGNFLRAWGWDVVQSGGAGDVSTDAFEICEVAADCKAGKSSESGGAVSFGGSVAVDSSGHVWIADGANHRFEEFEPNGAFIAAYGWDVDVAGGSGELEKCTSTAPGACRAATSGSSLGQFGSGPSNITIDSAGFIYAVDVGNDRIERFNSAMTAASLFAPNLVAEAGLPSFSAGNLLAIPGGFVFTAHIGGGGSSGEERLLELDGSGQLVETSLAGDGLPAVESLAVNETTGAVYATLFNAANRGPGVAVITDGPPPAPPALAIEPPTGIGGEEATLHATVDPGGLLVGDCKFQYSTDQVAWKDLPETDCTTLDREGGPQQLSATLKGLEPGSEYFVRFKAGRYYYAGANATSGEAGFTTISLPPIVSDVGAALITGTSAYLAGEVKPRSQSFEYHFEYGTTPALGSFTPAVELTGSKQVIVSQQITGLQPETTYYLRLLATNVAGTTESEPTSTFHTRPTSPSPPECPNEAFRVGPSANLPDCRAYEQATPPEKNFNNPQGGFAAADGEAVIFGVGSGFGEPPAQITQIFGAYRAARTASGWHTRWPNEPFCVSDPQEPHFQSAIGGVPSAYSPNLDFLAILHPESESCPFPPLDPAAPTPQWNLYRADYRTEPPGFDLLAPQPGGELRLGQRAGQYAGANRDWSRLFYTSAGQQTPDAPAGDFQKVFEWQEGSLKLVSISPAGNPFTSSALVPEDALHGVSEEGNRVFFMTPVTESRQCTPATCELYMRQKGTKTFDVSRSECTSACGESFADEFLAATPDGSKVLFRSKAKLTDEDTAGNGSDLYLYAHSSNPPVDQNLTLLSGDEEPADGTGARALGVLGMSEDGETAYFVAEGQLVAGAPAGGAGPKVYRWQANGGSPALTYLATLAPGADANNWSGSGPNETTRGAVREVSPDGEHLLVRTAARIDPGADHDSDRDVYRWSEADGWLCLSCQAPASPSAGDAVLPVTDLGEDTIGNYLYVMSEDGGRVFFATADALVPADTNERRDVYEWQEDGRLSLISAGTDSTDVNFIGASSSGHDVFFSTYKSLVGWDADDNSDIYDARVGGGFPEPPPSGAPCEGEACRSAPSSAPDVPGAGTAQFEAPVQKPKPCPRGKREVRRHGKVRCASRHRHKHRRHHKRSAKHNRRASR